MSQLQNRSGNRWRQEQILVSLPTAITVQVGRRSAGVAGVSRHAVSFAFLAFSFHQQSPLHVSPTFALKTVSNKVQGFDVVLTFVFAFSTKYKVLTLFLPLSLPFLSLSFCCSRLSCLCLLPFAFAFLVAFALLAFFLLYPASRDPLVQHHQRACPLVLGSNQTASS